MLKRNMQLSKNARHLYMTMRALANGRTGELKLNGRWLPAVAIDSDAEMCRDVRMSAMRELITFGFVTTDRERIERFIGGRKRVVLGRTRYRVHRQPMSPCSKISKKPNVLLKSISSTVEEIDSQDLSNPPCLPAPSAVGFRSCPKSGPSKGEESGVNDSKDDAGRRCLHTGESFLKTRSKKLTERIASKLKDDTLKEYGLGSNEERWRLDGACRAIGYSLDVDSPIVGIEFADALSLVYEKHFNEGLLPGILATKVIDHCMREKILYPPDFVEHRDRLRKRERACERRNQCELKKA